MGRSRCGFSADPERGRPADRRGRRTARSGCWDCSRRKLRGLARPRDAIVRLRAFARGELGVGEARRRFVAHAAAREVSAPAAVAAARAAGQAASIPHMGAHAPPDPTLSPRSQLGQHRRAMRG
ncbi:MAG: putative immunity protein [Solirubrobacteraceae bacterium]